MIETSLQETPAQKTPAWLLGVAVCFALFLTGVFVWWLLADNTRGQTSEVVATTAPSAGDTATIKPIKPADPSLVVRTAPRPGVSIFRPTPQPAIPMPVGNDPGPTLVTLRLDKVSPQSALDQLSKASGMLILASSNGGWNSAEGKTITLDVEKQPFWTVFMDVCGQLGAYPENHGAENQGRITIASNAGSRLPCPRIINGSFAITAESISHTVTASLAGQNQRQRMPQDQLQVQLTLFTEPKLPVFSVPSSATIEQAVDEAGHDFTPQARNLSYYGGGGSSGNWLARLNVSLQCPPGLGKTIAHLKGYANVVTAGGAEDFEINDVTTARGVQKTIDGVQIEFKQLAHNGSYYDAQFVAHGNMRDPKIYQRFSGSSSRMTLTDADGRVFRYSGGGSGGGSDGFTFNVNFSAAAGTPAKLVFSVPTDLKEIRVPFDFTDLPLP